MSFVHCAQSSATPNPSDACIVVQGDRLLARIGLDGALVFPKCGELPDHLGSAELLGDLEGATCWTRQISAPDATPPVGWEWHETRTVLGVFTPAQMQAVSCARELHWWKSRHRYCGCCGTPTVDVEQERAKRCPSCNALFFPVISPAVIVAVTRGDELLLAHNKNFRVGMFSLLAGFVDPGETLEQAAIREVREETGIEIGGLRYVTSQPWPFPNSLMLGFRANFVSGELAVDGKEIEQADWFRRDAMPEIPRKGTVARLIIDQWLSET